MLFAQTKYWPPLRLLPGMKSVLLILNRELQDSEKQNPTYDGHAQETWELLRVNILTRQEIYMFTVLGFEWFWGRSRISKEVNPEAEVLVSVQLGS